MTGWTPLFQRIICSSLWDQGDHVRLAWVTMLAMSSREGVVPIKSPAGLARMARIDLDKAEDALRVLSSPDPAAPEGDLEDGRRIRAHPGGWEIVKWAEYRELTKAAIRRETNAAYQAIHREKVRGGGDETAGNGDATPDRFDDFWKVYPRRQAKPLAIRAWKRVQLSEVEAILKDVCDRAMTEDWKKEGGKYIPLPSTYLNQRRWEDETKPPVAYPKGGGRGGDTPDNAPFFTEDQLKALGVKK